MKRYLSKNLILFFVIYLCIFIGSINKIFVFPSLALAFIISLALGISAKKSKDSSVCIGIISLLIFQNLLIGLGAHLAGNHDSSLKFMTQIPFISVFNIWIVNILNNSKNNKMIFGKERKYFIIYLLCIVFSFFVGRGNFQGILINIRNMTIFFMAFEIGKYYLDTKDKMDSFFDYLMKMAFFILVFGIILQIFGYKLYSIIGVDEVYIAKGSTLPGGKLDDRFYTTLISSQVIRMGSIFYEPVNLAYFYAMTLIMSIFYKKNNKQNNKMFNIIINGLGLFLTFGKGGYLLFFSCIGFIVITKFIKKLFFATKVKKILKYSCLLIVIVITTFCIYYYKNIGAAVSPHFWAVIRTWNSVLQKPYGHGLGTGGNMSLLFNTGKSTASYDSSWLATGGESALMSFMYQLGIQGVLCLFICMLSMVKKIRDKTEYNNFYKIIWFLPVVIVGVALLQDNTFTPQCIVLIMLIIGGTNNLEEKNEA